MIEVAISTVGDAADVLELKIHLQEFSDLITSSPIFNTNNNKDDIGALLYTFLEDLYITEPKEVIDFVNQIPSKKLVNNIFSKFGISERISNNFPTLLKTKTCYLLNQLFENKGNNKAFDLFNEILEEFFKDMNFYDIRVEQRKIITKYESPIIEQLIYLNTQGDPLQIYADQGITSSQINVHIDLNINYQIYPIIERYSNRVKYDLRFFEPLDYDGITDWTTPYDIQIKLNYSDTFVIKQDVTSYLKEIRKYDIYDELTQRSEDQLSYVANPVLITDPRSIITTIQPTDLRTNKYLMELPDFYDKDIRNNDLKNIFPISTNALFIQFNTSETLDTMKQLLDLVRIFSMTYLQDELFTFQIGLTIVKLTIDEYIKLLVYTKLTQLTKRSPEWVWEAPDLLSASLLFPKDQLDEIYALLLYYQDMPHDYKKFNEFKRRYNILMGQYNQLSNTSIFNMTQFREYLYGNIPENFQLFFEKLEEFFPNGVNIINGIDQNKLLKEQIYFIEEHYNPATTEELFELVASDDKEYNGLTTSLYDMLKQKFISKYPRMVQSIELLEGEEFVEIYLQNYKRLLTETRKMDNLIGFFVNDLFKNFIFDSTFKEEFLDPVVDMFQQYFFKAELSYQNSDRFGILIKDKMQQVVLGDDAGFMVDLADIKSELSQKDNFVITITRDDTKTIITSENDVGY